MGYCTLGSSLRDSERDGFFSQVKIYMCCVDIVQYLFLLLVVVNEDLDTECRVTLSKIQSSALLHKTQHIIYY